MISKLLVRPCAASLVVLFGQFINPAASAASDEVCPDCESITVLGTRHPPFDFGLGSFRFNRIDILYVDTGDIGQWTPLNPRDRNRDGRIDCWKYLYDQGASYISLRSRFGLRCPVELNTDECSEGEKEFHNGIDVAMPSGTELYAARGGTVIRVVEGVPENPPGSTGSGGGNQVLVLYPDGRVGAYLHIRSTKLNVGDEVSVGDVVGLSNNSGNSTGPHLHYSERHKDWREGDQGNKDRYHDPQEEYNSCDGDDGS